MASGLHHRDHPALHHLQVPLDHPLLSSRQPKAAREDKSEVRDRHKIQNIDTLLAGPSQIITESCFSSSKREQLIMWWGGLRGAVGFSLAMVLKEEMWYRWVFFYWPGTGVCFFYWPGTGGCLPYLLYRRCSIIISILNFITVIVAAPYLSYPES